MKDRGYRLSEIAAAVGGQLALSDADERITSLSIDSRRITATEGCLFFALVGDRHDGHAHIAELARRGMRNFVVASGWNAAVPGLNTIVVRDTLAALQQLAAWHRAHFDLPVIGITGSNGKTVVKEWLYELLRHEERIVRSPGSWNSQVGVPLSVWELGAEHSLALFEAGISQRGEMSRLRPIVAPTIGVLTTIGPAHGEGFTDDAEKAREKCTLFHSAQAVICCTDQEIVRKAVEHCSLAELRDWSRTHTAFVQVMNEEVQANATVLALLHGGRTHELAVPFTDRASVDNALTCITVLLHLGRDAHWIAEHLATLRPVEMRLRTMQGVHDITLIDDSYSNDLASLGIALAHQVHMAHGRKRAVVLGDIAESALDSGRLYAAMAQQLAGAGIDRIIAVGAGIGHHRASFPSGTEFHVDTDALLRDTDVRLLEGHVVLVKGARHLHLEAVVQRWQQQVHGTLLEVDLDAVRHNLNHYRSLVRPPVRTMAMVKAFGYGSGAVELARLLAHERVDYLGVAYADEGIELRQQGIATPILVMNPEPVPFETLHRFDLEAEVFDRSSLRAAIDHARHMPDAPPVHLKLDTGMHRLGFQANEIPDLLEAMRGSPLRVASILSHLAASEDPQHDVFTRDQLVRFGAMADRIDAVLGYRPLRHIANSAAVARFPEAHLDMVRLGIGLHGIGADPFETARLLPTATLRTVIAQVKTIAAGEGIGYGRRSAAPHERRIAVLPIGYADGFSRRLGNGTGRVWINGHEAHTVGNICMDMCMVDVSAIACSPGDDVVVFGKDAPLGRYAEDLGTIPYEALTSIAQRVKRVYVRG